MSRFSTTRDPQLRSRRWKQLRRSGAKFRFPPGSTDDSSTSKLPTLTLSMTRGRPSMPRLKSDWRKMTSSSRKESTTTSSQNSHTTKDSKNSNSTLPPDRRKKTLRSKIKYSAIAEHKQRTDLTEP